MEQKLGMDIKEIQRLLPHAYPFLLVDRVLEYEAGKSITAVKNVTINEPFFVGHFPGEPVMPGVLIIEALAQASLLCVLSETGDSLRTGEKTVSFMSIDAAKFRKRVTPGDVLVLKSRVVHRRGGSCRFDCQAFVEELATEAQILAMVS